MSARIKTILPLISKELVLEALKKMGETVKVEGHIIHILSRSNSYYPAKLTRIGRGRYVLTGDSDCISGSFQSSLLEMYRELNELQKKVIQKKRMDTVLTQAENEEMIRKQDIQERIRREQEELRRKSGVQKGEEAPSITHEAELVANEVNEFQQQEALMLQIEEEKRQYVESQKKELYEKAKQMGYKVKEKQVDGKVKLELIKRVY